MQSLYKEFKKKAGKPLFSKSNYFRNFLSVLAAVSLLALSACGGGGGGGEVAAGFQGCLDLGLATNLPPAEVVADDSNDRMEITNSDAALEQFITCSNTDVPVETVGTPKASKPTQTTGISASAPVILRGRWKGGFSLRLIGQASPPKIVGKAVGVPYGITGDLTSGGSYTGTQQSPPYVLYRVQIDATGTPDTFKWSDDDGTTWQATSVAITAGSAQTLSNGVTVTFANDTGHTVGNYWNIAAGILQATSVAVKGSSIIVSYSMAGNPYLGAIRLYRSFFGFPWLRSQALFRDTDVNAVTISSSDVYAVGASEPASPPDAGILEKIGLFGSRLVLSGNNPLVLKSYAGNSVIYDSTNGKIYATSGNGGGLTVVDETTFTEDTGSYSALADARWVEMEGTTLVVAQGGNATGVDGQISVFDVNGGAPTSPNSYGFTGADIAQSKSTVEIVGAKAFVAAGSGGAEVMSTATGSSLANIPIPTGTGLPNNKVVANAVSVDNDLMFISNGEAGVYVAQADEDFDVSGAAGPVNLTLLGKLKFGSLQSVNHVAFKGNYLYIAAGLGGLKIVRINVP